MSSNVQKTPIGRTLEQFAQRKARQAIVSTGRSLPASVAEVVGSGVVTVKFELTNTPYTLPNITVPMIGSEYIRLPIQVGCLGWVMSADAYLGGVSGLGGGTADLSQRGNLSMLVWSPIGNKTWTDPDNANAVVIYGPDGVVLRDLGKKNTFTLTPSGVTLDITAGDFVINVPMGQKVKINGAADVSGNLTVEQNILLGGSIESVGGGLYAGDFKTAGDITAGFGTGDAVTVRNHTHLYDRPTGASSPAQTVKPTAGT